MAFRGLSAARQPRYRHVISANPFGLVLLFFNAELERALNRTSTLGIGGSFVTGEDVLGEEEV